MAIPIINNGMKLNSDEIVLANLIVSNFKANCAISEKYLPHDRIPKRSDITPECMSEVESNSAEAQLLFEELHGIGQERFSIFMPFLCARMASINKKMAILYNECETAFEFELGASIAIVVSDEHGTVIGQAKHQHSEDSYFIRYKTADGCAVDAWWPQSALVACHE